MFKVIKKEGSARRGEFQCAHGYGTDAGFYECRHPGGYQGRAQCL